VSRRRRRPLEDERSDARERGLALLYEAESKGIAPRAVLAAQVAPLDPLTTVLVEGVEDHQPAFDELISSHAKGWSLARMPALDRAVLRMALAELKVQPETPSAVVLDEAVELAKRFSTDDSGRFVNGMLAAMLPKVRGSGDPSEPAAEG
jgi:transcription antitermination protein NusB